MKERARFVAEYERVHYTMTGLGRFGVSRKTGYEMGTVGVKDAMTS